MVPATILDGALGFHTQFW